MALSAVSATRAVSVRVPARARRTSVAGLTGGRPRSGTSSPRPVWSTRPSRSTTSRSAYAAIRGSWVTSTTVVRCSRASRTSWVSTCSPASVSSAPVGSSAKSTRGSVTSARAVAHRCCWPPDISPGRTSATSATPSRSSQVSAAVRASRRPVPARSSGRATFSAAVSSATSWPNWNSTPNSVRRSRDRAASDQVSIRSPAPGDLAGVGPEDAGEAVQQGGLAAAARPGDRRRSPPRPRRGSRRAARASGRTP